MSEKNTTTWTYCSCAGTHARGCPNAGNPDALPPLADDDDETNRK